MSRKQRSESKSRFLIAHESAKIIAEEGIKDFRLAKNKAATRLGFGVQVNLPSNTEVETALQEYQRLFKSESYPVELQNTRKLSLKVMSLLRDFQPHLVGPVLTGLYSPHQEVHLHLYAHTVEEIIFFLFEQDMPFTSRERRYRFQDNTYEYHPVLLLTVDDIEFDITVFAKRQIHDVPCSPVDGKPMQRATLQELHAIIEQDSQ